MREIIGVTGGLGVSAIPIMKTGGSATIPIIGEGGIKIVSSPEPPPTTFNGMSLNCHTLNIKLMKFFHVFSS